MTKREILQNRYDMACHNLICYSANYLLTGPKAGYEREWENASKECELLEIMLNEYPKENGEFQFIGTISSTYMRMSQAHQEQYMESLIIQDREGNSRMFGIGYEVGKDLLATYDIERHKRYNLEKNTEIIFTVDNFSQKVIKWEWRVN